MATRSIVPRADGEGSIGTLAKQWGAVYAKNILTSDAAAHNSLYRGQEITDSWATIKANIQAGDFSNYYIGDYKTITLTTDETVVMEIAGINCYNGWGNTAIGNHIDFISRDCLATAYQFNTTATNNGTSARNGVFIASNIYNVLNENANSVFSTLPSDVKNKMISKVCYLEERYSSGGAVSSDISVSWKTIALWLPSEIEVFGHATWSEAGCGTAGFIQYPIFRLNPSKIVKGAGNGGEARSWWTLSAAKNSSQDFCYVSSTGASLAEIATNAYMRVPLCFRIG